MSDEMLEAASAAGKLHQQALAPLVTGSLDPEHLAAEDDPAGDPASLCTQLAAALSQVDGASAITCALETIGTPSKPKVASVLPAGSLASAMCRSMRRRATHDYLRCSARTNRGTCETRRTLLMSEVEERVL
ncbi:MAG TPA: hypothetical protein VH913_13035 [Hyphomicrobiaceae bacterium]